MLKGVSINPYEKRSSLWPSVPPSAPLLWAGADEMAAVRPGELGP